MKRILTTALVAGIVGLVPLNNAVAEDETGVARAGSGVVDTVTSPGQIVEGVKDQTEKHGAVGVVTGPVVGGAKAAAQAVTGAAKIGVGTVEAVTAPLTGGN